MENELRQRAMVHLQAAQAAARAGQLPAAIAEYRAAAALRPDEPEIQFELANALWVSGQFADAIAAYREAIRLRPDYADALLNCGIALANSGRRGEAHDVWQAVLELNPNDIDALNNLASLCRSAGKIGQAIDYCRRALAIDANHVGIVNTLGSAYDQQGDLDQAVACYRRALQLAPHSIFVRSNLLLALTYQQALSPGEVYDEHREWNRLFAEPLRAEIQPHTNDRSPDRVLRVGYLSPDFRQHAVSFFLEPILQHHDRGQVEVFCYSGVARPDAVTARIRSYGHAWREMVGVRDAAVAEMIRQDRIDILIELSGHTSGNRLLIFARKPAPIQVAFLGYLNTTGLDVVDYRMTDAWADPPGMTDPVYSEKIVRLPRCGWCFHPFEEAPPVAPAPHEKNGYVTFGSFNKLSKLSAAVIEAWATLLKNTPGTRLLLKWGSLADESTRQRFFRLFAERGVEARRIELESGTPSMAEHLGTYGRIDLGLDTFPYNGATTTCDALWMGIPVVTLAGNTHAGRIGVSLLHAIGLEDLIAQTPEQYVHIATALARDPKRLSELRGGMRARVAGSALREPLSLTRAVEAAYRQMWHAWCMR